MFVVRSLLVGYFWSCSPDRDTDRQRNRQTDRQREKPTERSRHVGAGWRRLTDGWKDGWMDSMHSLLTWCVLHTDLPTLSRRIVYCIMTYLCRYRHTHSFTVPRDTTDLLSHRQIEDRQTDTKRAGPLSPPLSLLSHGRLLLAAWSW